MAKTSEVEFLKNKNRYYSAINKNKKFKKDINHIFTENPIYSNAQFAIRNIEDIVLDKMFTDLVYTGRMGRKYANSPYDVYKEKDHYRAKIKQMVDGTIEYIVKDRNNNHFIFMVKGVYDTFVTLRGKMLVDIRYYTKGHLSFFEVQSYVIIDNSLIWGLTKLLNKNKGIQKKIINLYIKNINYTIRLGKKTAYGIKKDLKKNKF